jgi:hypothetical protein
MDWDDILKRTTMANVVAATVVMIGMTYCFLTQNTDGVLLITGAGMGWLFKEITNG